MQPLFHLDELGRLAFEELGHRHARPGGHDLGDVVRVNLFLEQPVRTGERGDRRLLLLHPQLQLGQLAVLELGGGAVVGLALGLVDSNLQGFDLRLCGPNG